MKLMTLSDIHQMSDKWKKLIKACEKEKPDVVAIAGDLFPKDNGIIDQINFVKHVEKYVNQIKHMGIEVVLILGNDDNQLLIPKFQELDEKGLFHFVHDKVKIVKGYEFVGMPWVPDYPFTYKFWVKSDLPEDMHISIEQLGNPCILNDENQFEDIKERYINYLFKKGTIKEQLDVLISKVQNMNKSIWLIHAPPAFMKLDVCGHGEEVGSKAITFFVEHNNPMLTIHGHIHESPEVTGIWKKQVGDTLVIQNGQLHRDLYYSMVKIEDDRILEVKHSIYGYE